MLHVFHRGVVVFVSSTRRRSLEAAQRRALGDGTQRHVARGAVGRGRRLASRDQEDGLLAALLLVLRFVRRLVLMRDSRRMRVELRHLTGRRRRRHVGRALCGRSGRRSGRLLHWLCGV